MTTFRLALICLFLPPLAVVDKGFESFFIVTLLTAGGWFPGSIAALIICFRKRAV